MDNISILHTLHTIKKGRKTIWTFEDIVFVDKLINHSFIKEMKFSNSELHLNLFHFKRNTKGET